MLEVSVVSLGDYVLNGGEVAVLAMVEAVARLLPGVIGNAESLVEESHEDGLLEYPVYTKPVLGVWPGVPSRAAGAALRRPRGHRRVAAPAAARPHRRRAGPTCCTPRRRSTDRRPGRSRARRSRPTPRSSTILQRACWVTEAGANATLDIPALVEDVDEVPPGLRRVADLGGPRAAAGWSARCGRARSPDDPASVADRPADGRPRPAGPRARPGAAGATPRRPAPAGTGGILAQHRHAQRTQPAHLPQGGLPRAARRGRFPGTVDLVKPASLTCSLA